MNGLSVHHVAMATSSLEEAIPLYERLTGARSSPVEELPAQGVRVSFVGNLELLEPLSPDSTVARFLDRNGPGLHHIAYRTPDIRSELRRLADRNFELIDLEPRPGAGGHMVAFIHPRSTGGILVELVEHPDESAQSAQ
jgi:methylmalonyl-CoA/ethylmalonyl-CoA epimerase